MTNWSFSFPLSGSLTVDTFCKGGRAEWPSLGLTKFSLEGERAEVRTTCLLKYSMSSRGRPQLCGAFSAHALWTLNLKNCSNNTQVWVLNLIIKLIDRLTDKVLSRMNWETLATYNSACVSVSSLTEVTEFKGSKDLSQPYAHNTSCMLKYNSSYMY